MLVLTCAATVGKLTVFKAQYDVDEILPGLILRHGLFWRDLFHDTPACGRERERERERREREIEREERERERGEREREREERENGH